jgi:Cu/Ag efflux protein CusF
MMPSAGFACCALFLTAHATAAYHDQEQRAQSAPQTLTATIEGIDKATRMVTLKGAGGTSLQIRAPEEMEGFNSLRVGDQVTAMYYDALAVSVRKPGDPAPPAASTTMTQRKDRTPGSETRRQLNFTVTIEAIDPRAPSITVKGPQGRVVTLPVRDATQLQKVRIGDTVDVTYFESLLIRVTRPSK